MHRFKSGIDFRKTLLRLISGLLMFTSLYSSEITLKRRQIYIGPDWYYVTRKKEGGTKQSGNMLGVRLGYDRFKRYGWYLGEEIRYAKGTLHGHTSNKDKLKSHLTDCLVEGRFGYTFQQKKGCQLSFTPFLGIGYFNEKNHYTHDSPLPIHFNTQYTYGAFGFFSWAHINNWEGGLNFLARYPYEPRCYVSHDPDHASVKQNIKSKMQYRVEIPIGYSLADTCFSRYLGCGIGVINLVPYYEYRHYGNHPNYPFNFIKTEFQIWGLTLELMYRM